MRKIWRSACVLSSIVFGCLSAVSSGYAHEGKVAEELGHHWDVPAYTHEIRLQLAVILIAACIFAVGMLIARGIRKKRVQG